MIYTSWYGDRTLERTTIVFPISLGLPKFPTVYRMQRQILQLAPTRDLLSMGKEQYAENYKRMLNRRHSTIMDIFRSLEQGAGSRDVVLCCFEDIRSGSKWCHRTMLAEWVKLNINKQVDEWSMLRNNIPVQTKPEQLALF